MTPKTSSELLEEEKYKLIANYSSTTQGKNPIGAIDMSTYMEQKSMENASNYVRLGNLPSTFSTTQKLLIEKGYIILNRERLMAEEEESKNFKTIDGLS